jgi:excisionase family DNA binding protein
MEDLLTLEDVARILQITPYTVRKYINQGKLEGVMVVGRWRVRPEALRKFVENRIKPETDQK